MKLAFNQSVKNYQVHRENPRAGGGSHSVPPETQSSENLNLNSRTLTMFLFQSDDDDVVYKKNVRAVKGSRSVPPKNPGSKVSSNQAAMVSSTGPEYYNAAPSHTPRASAIEIQKRRKIMFDSDDDDDDMPYMVSTTTFPFLSFSHPFSLDAPQHTQIQARACAHRYTHENTGLI